MGGGLDSELVAADLNQYTGIALALAAAPAWAEDVRSRLRVAAADTLFAGGPGATRAIADWER